MLAVAANSPIAVRPAAVGRDAHRAVPAGGRHAQPDAAHARDRGARQLRHPLGARSRSSRSSRRTSRASARWSAPTSTRIRWRVLDARRGAAAQGAAPAQRHDLPLEPRLLRHHRRQAAPAHREPRDARRAEHARRGRERRVLVRADGRARRARGGHHRAASTSTRPARTSTPRRARASARTSRGSTARTSRRATLVLERLLPLAEAGPAPAEASTTPTSSATSASSSSACARRAPARAGSCRRGTRCAIARRRASARTRWSPRRCSAS